MDDENLTRCKQRTGASPTEWEAPVFRIWSNMWSGEFKTESPVLGAGLRPVDLNQRPLGPERIPVDYFRYIARFPGLFVWLDLLSCALCPTVSTQSEAVYGTVCGHPAFS